MGLLEDLKIDMKNRIDRVDSTEDMLTLFSKLSAPLDTVTLNSYFKWYRIKTQDEIGDISEDSFKHLYYSNQTQNILLETNQVRLIEVDGWLVNEALQLKLRPEWVEAINTGGTNGAN